VSQARKPNIVPKAAPLVKKRSSSTALQTEPKKAADSAPPAPMGRGKTKAPAKATSKTASALKKRGKASFKPVPEKVDTKAAAAARVAARAKAKQDAKAAQARKDEAQIAQRKAVPPKPLAPEQPLLAAAAQDALERRLNQAQFTISAGQLVQLPEEGLPEVAFCGRSNAGKSSALNTLCNRKKLAFVSKTPGRTQLINMFGLGYIDPDNKPKLAPTARLGSKNRHYAQPEDDAPKPLGPAEAKTDVGQLVDLPGYGFASAPMAVKKKWESLIGQYLVKRHSLAGLFLVMDIRHPLTKLDWELLEWVRPDVTPVHALLTKCDKISREAARKTLREVKQELANAGYQVTASTFSSLKREGIAEALAALNQFLQLEDRIKAAAATKL
jgi:GTP-binding protein